MARTRFGDSYWLMRVPVGRRPSWPRPSADATTTVVIVGGGLTGCFTAHAFAMAGIHVVVLEANRIGQGATAAGSGIALQQPDEEFRALVSARGLRAARSVFRASRRAALDMAAALRRLGTHCDLDSVEAVEVARTPGDEIQLQREAQARRQAGLEARWRLAAHARRETGAEVLGGIRTAGHVVLDPYRACLDLAGAAARRGAQVYERAPVDRIRADRGGVEVRAAGRTIRADTVIVATGEPLADHRALRRHFVQQERYFVATEPLPGPLRRQVTSARLVLRDTLVPPHEVRWTRDDRLIMGGADQARVAERLRAKTLTQRTGQLMYELSLLYPAISGIPPAAGWHAPVTRTADGIPCIGPHRNFPGQLFAFGLGRSGPGLAFLASRILLRTYLGEPAQDDEHFGFARLLG